MPSGPALTSWKEIAAHFGKGVRTVQRWERELGLPVRRPVGLQKNTVVALPQELDEWLRTKMRPRPEENDRRPSGRTVAVREMERMQQLVSIMRSRREEIHRSISALSHMTRIALSRGNKAA